MNPTNEACTIDVAWVSLHGSEPLNLCYIASL